VSAPLVVVHRDATVLAQAVAARIITVVVDAQAARGEASIVLTGGGIGGATLRELAESPARFAIDWSRLSVWWGDERFLPSGHPDRNETQAREALLDRMDVDPDRVHPMPASDGPLGDDLDAAAEQYAVELAAAARPEDHGGSPHRLTVPRSPGDVRRPCGRAGARLPQAATDPAVVVAADYQPGSGGVGNRGG
jgi:6-phosphogluconolactonase